MEASIETLSGSEVNVKPYAERSTNNLLYLKAALEQRGELVPLDVLTTLSSRGYIV